jgi:site-specific recombinase XerD
MEQPRESKNDKGKTIKIRGKSTATVSIYSRTLRAVFNYAISQGYITRELYPFGTNKYIPSAKRNSKNFLTSDEIKSLLVAEIDELSPQKKARDFFILSYLCNGMNIGDILNLKNKQLKDDGFEFYRIKTKSQRKEAITPIKVSFKDSWKKHVWSIIEFYKNDDMRPEAYLFPVYNDAMDELTRYRVKKNFTRFIDQHLLKLCKKIGSNYARHTFASMLSNSDAPIIEIRDLLGHTEISTTEGYLHSLGSKKTSEALNNLI